MRVIDTKIPDIKIIEPQVFEDERGFFYESYNQRKFEKVVGQEVKFVQDNHSRSVKGVLRGLHYQLSPKAQGKLVRVTEGEIFDVVVDLRRNSPYFLQWVGEYISEDNKRMVWAPPGFAHGFFVMSDAAEVLYKTTEFYDPEYEVCVIWNDSELNIAWPFTGEPMLSEKDTAGSLLRDVAVFA